MDVCTFLDPRVKALPYLSPAEREIIIDKVLDYCINDAATLNKEIVAEKRTTDSIKNSKPLTSLLSSMYDESAERHVSCDTNYRDIVTLEIKQYLSTSSCDMGSCPLKWWKSNAYKYPHLSRQARKYLAIQGTSVAAERVFSTAGIILSSLRNRLDPKLVNYIIFLNKNLKMKVQ